MTLKCFIFCFIMFVIWHQVTSEETGINPKEVEIKNDLPLKQDLAVYLTRLEMILNFIQRRRNIVDINFGFGLFLTGVNLKSFLMTKGYVLPQSLNSIFQRVMKKHTEAVRFFSSKVEHQDRVTKTVTPSRRFLDLYNEQMWAHHLQAFNLNLTNITKTYTPQQLIGIYSPWSQYISNLYVETEMLLQTKCINSLAILPRTRRADVTTCKLPKDCLERGYTGSDYGYLIFYRILLLIMVRFARGCTLVSEREDKEMLDTLCAKVYNEMEYISFHNFQMVDLVVAQISLCSLEGHAQLVRRSWFEKILSYQRKPGCFPENSTSTMVPVRTPRVEWQLEQPQQDIMGGFCNSRTTGFATSAISSAIRYILETQF